MTLTVTVPADGPSGLGAAFTVVDPDARDSELDHSSAVVPGLHVVWNPFAPHQWQRLWSDSRTKAMDPIIAALVGRDSVPRLRAAFQEMAASGAEKARIQDTRAPVTGSGPQLPWLRLAAVDALDRWLWLPLDESLVTAERAACRLAAAHTLDHANPLRDSLIDEALRLARRAATGVTEFCTRIAGLDQPIPVLLRSSLERLTAAYWQLSAEVTESDDTLAAVGQAWLRVAEMEVAPLVGTAPPVSTAPPAALEQNLGGGAGGFIDPHQVHGRVLQLSDQLDRPDIDVTEVESGDGPALAVRVRSLHRHPGREIQNRLLVRLVAGHAEPISYGLLHFVHGNPVSHFEGRVPLRGRSRAGVRVDVYDMFSEQPPAPSDTDEALQRARRASAFLRDWRHLVAQIRLGISTVSPSGGLARILQRVAPAAMPPASQLWSGEPAFADLSTLIRLDDATLHSMATEPPASAARTHRVASIATSVNGPGDLLVAEIAAAWAHSASEA